MASTKPYLSQRQDLIGVFLRREKDWRNGGIVYQIFVDCFAPSLSLQTKIRLYQSPRTLQPWNELPKRGVKDAHTRYWSHELAFWGGDLEVLDEEENFTYAMEAISVSDSRVSSIKSKLKNPEFLYVLRIVLPSTVATFSKTYTRTNGGTAETFDGNLTLKIIQADVVDVGEEVIPNWYGQAPESGVVNNLTPETIYIPPFLQEAPWEGSGAWNNDPVALTAGTYTAVWGSQIFEVDTAPEFFLGLISITA